MEYNKIIPQIENCGKYNNYSNEYNRACECKTCLNKILKNNITNGHINYVSSLLGKYKFDQNSLNLVLIAALYSHYNSVEKMNLLLEEGANPNYVDLQSGSNDKETILYTAIENGYIPIIECLLKHGANPNLNKIGTNSNINNYGVRIPSNLHAICNYEDRYYIIRDNIDRESRIAIVIDLLLNYGLNIDESGINISVAIRSQNINLISYILNKTRNSPIELGVRPFHTIAKSGVSIRKENGINITVESPNNALIFNMLFDSKYREYFDIPESEHISITPLHYAVIHGNTEIVRCLLEKGANPNSIDSLNGFSIFKDCSEIKGQSEIKALLLLYGANVHDAEYNNTLPEEVRDFSSVSLLYCLEQTGQLSLLDASIIIDIVELNRLNSYNTEQPVLYNDGRFYCRNCKPYFKEDELPLLRLTNGPPSQEEIDRQVYQNNVRLFVRNHFQNVDRKNGIIANNGTQQVFDFDALMDPNFDNYNDDYYDDDMDDDMDDMDDEDN